MSSQYARRIQRNTRQPSRQVRRRRLFEQLESRHLLAGDVLFADSFEVPGVAPAEWLNWVEDSQNDWFRSTQRSTDGSYSAEVDGRATNATLTMANAVDLIGYETAELTFDWYIESGFDGGEYLSMDVSSDGGANWQNDVRRLSGNVDAENTWHNATVDLTPYASSNLLVRFRSLVSRSNEDANVDNVQITGVPDNAPPIGLISHWTAENTSLDAEGNNDGTLASGASYEAGQIGQAFSFDGVDDRVLVEDSSSLRLTKSMTIEAWVRVDSFPTSGHGLVMFRGDDRGGLDPYQITTTPNGEIHFGISSLTSGTTVVADMPQGEFVYVAGTLDDSTGEMSLYLNGVRMEQKITSERPFGALDPGSNPGIGIGNHGGFPTTPHNFPFHGAIDELKIHDLPLSAGDVLANFIAGKGDPEISINDVSVVEGDSGFTFTDAFVSAGNGGLSSPRGIALGPDGNLYVASTDTDSVLRYNAATGAFMGEFVASGSGGLDFSRDLEFHNGDLFVVSGLTNSVLRFDGASGAFVNEFVASGSGGLEAPRGLTFGSNNDLYVTSAGEDDAILRYNATTGVFIDEFIASGDHGMNNPTRVVIGPDTNFYVSSSNSSSNSVLRYDPDGNFIDTFVASGVGGLDGPTDILFDDGLMYVASARSDSVLAYDQTTGDFAGVVVTAGSGGLDNPNSMLIDNDGRLYVSSRVTHQVLRYEDVNTSVSTVNLSWPSTQVITVDFATTDGSAIAGIDYESTTGTVTFAPGDTSQAILVPILNDAVAEPNETFEVILADPVNATVSDASGVVTIIERTIAVEDVTVTEGDLAPPFAFASAAIGGANFNTLAFGPDGDLFVELGEAAGLSNSILRFDGTTGASKGIFVTNNWMGTTRDLLFRDGVLYVADLNAPTQDAVKMFDATTGEPLGTFVGDDPATGVDETGGLVGAEGLVFGPDGNGDGEDDLYVTGWFSNNILRYDGLTGAYIDTIVTGISSPHGIELHNGNLLVTSQTNQVLEYEPDGTFIRAIGSSADGLNNPIDIAIGPHDGHLYVTSGHTSKVIRYDLNTGAYIDDFATAADGLDYTRSLTFHNGALYVTSINNDDVVRFAIETEPEIVFTVAMTAPSNSVVDVDFSTSDGTAIAGSDYLAVSGSITFAPGQTTKSIVIPTLDDTDFEGDETFNVTISSTGGVTIADDTGVGTIVNDDPVPPNDPPVADDDAHVVAEDAVLSVAAPGVLDGDTDMENDPLTAALVTQATGGVVVLNADGSFDYTPNPDFNGSDSFTYMANDGTSNSNVATVNLTVTAENDAPVANGQNVTAKENTSKAITLTGSDIDGDPLSFSVLSGPTSGSLSGTAPNLTYTPDFGFTGADSFTFITNDGTVDGAAGTVTINVADNNIPVADPQAVDVDEDGSVAILLTGSDPDSDPITFQIVDSPLSGNLTGTAPNVTYTPNAGFNGVDSFTFKVNDGTDDSSLATVALTVSPVNAGPKLSHGVVNVSSSWHTVVLPSSYTSMVVVATPNYDSGSAPAVTRMQGASGNSFQIRVDAAGPTAVGNIDVHYVVMEEGVYDEAGYKLEAVKYNSTVTDENNSWAGESRSYQQSYTAPVVIGQVMTYNDSNWSVFWAAGSSRTAPPSSSALTVGKNAGEDPVNTRADETIGYIVIETSTSGTAEIEGLPYVAAVGGDSVKGVDDSPAYSYSYSAMANSKTAIASQAGMDGGNGGWAVLYGSNPITPTGGTLNLAIDEDQSNDTERKHTTEQVAYFIIDPPPAKSVEATASITAPAAAKKQSMTTDDESKNEKVPPLRTGLRSTSIRIKSFGDARDGRHITPETSIERTEATDAAMADHVGLVSLFDEALLTMTI